MLVMSEAYANDYSWLSRRQRFRRQRAAERICDMIHMQPLQPFEGESMSPCCAMQLRSHKMLKGISEAPMAIWMSRQTHSLVRIFELS